MPVNDSFLSLRRRLFLCPGGGGSRRSYRKRGSIRGWCERLACDLLVLHLERLEGVCVALQLVRGERGLVDLSNIFALELHTIMGNRMRGGRGGEAIRVQANSIG